MNILDDTRTFGGACAESRKGRREKLREVAARCGLSVQYLCDIEHDRRAPTNLKTAFNLTEAYKLPDEAVALIWKPEERRRIANLLHQLNDAEF